jgi:predicted DNA-binding transcriptional regulator YafY
MTRAELEAALPGCRTRRLDLIEDYLFIGGDKLSAARAAERLGVTARTVQRCRSTLRATGRTS